MERCSSGIGATGLPDAVLLGHLSEVYAVAWSSQGLIASASLDRTIRAWNAETGKPDLVCRRVLEYRGERDVRRRGQAAAFDHRRGTQPRVPGRARPGRIEVLKPSEFAKLVPQPSTVTSR